MGVVDYLHVSMWGRDIGVVAWEKNSQLGYFEYEPDFLRSGIEISPIHMPLSSGSFGFSGLNRETYHGLPGAFADSLPDKFGNKLIEQWMIMNNRSSLSPLEKLSFVGSRAMGALEYRPDKGTFESGILEVSSLVQAAKELLEQRENIQISFGTTDTDRTHALKQLISVGTSAGGARAKAIIAYNEESDEIRSGQIDAPSNFKYYLIKFDGLTNRDKEDEDQVRFGVIEYIYYLMALEAGITMSYCRLFEEGDRKHFMTERFDRLKGGEKLHMQSLCAMGHYDFNNPRETGYELAFGVLEKLHCSRTDFIQLFTRMVYNVVARNQDDHTKNIAFLMNKKGQWRLSPAYDMCYSYNPKGDWTSTHQMTINSKVDNFKYDDFAVIADRFKIKSYKNIISQVINAVGSWHRLAEKYKLPPSQAKAISDTHRLSF